MKVQNKLKPHILYVDDDAENLDSFKLVFRKYYKIHLANSAQEGIEEIQKAESNNENIDVVISDQRMPQITGVEFLAKLALDYPQITRMIMTGYTDISATIDAINKGKVYHYISKPWKKDQLKAVIDEALSCKQKYNA